MTLKIKFILLALALFIFAYAMRDRSVPHNPVKDGMEHNTTGQEWQDKNYKKFNPKRMDTQ